MDRLRKRSHHRRPLYRFGDTDSDTTSEGAGQNRHSRPIRSSQRLRNQRDSLDDFNSDSHQSSAADPIQPTRIERRKQTSRQKKPQTNRYRTTQRRSKRRKITTHPPPSKHLSPRPRESISVEATSQHSPPWQNLDYQILLRIMQYAAYPLYEGASRDTGSIQWLLDMSRLCFSFRDACVGALMTSPPLYPANRAHGVLKLLKLSAVEYGDMSLGKRAQRKVSLDYRTKVKCLDIEVRHILLKKQGINLNELLKLTPLLKDLRLYHSHDALTRDFLWAQPKYAKGKRWNYGELFNTLDQFNIELTSFEWNGRFLRQDPSLNIVAHAQSHKCLQRLKTLSFLHLGVHTERDEQKFAECRANVLNALEGMNDLESLSIRNCDVLDSSTMALLSCTLRSLMIEDCIHVTSDAMRDYLNSRGSQLLVLRLLHNQSMSLDFMDSLQTMTPKLQHIEIDLTYYDTTSFRDTEPLFDSLLPSGCPTWPSSLTYISIEPLRLLTTADAEEFFGSLVSAAPSLPHLRELRLKTILNDTGWRDRAQLRSKWSAKIVDVFLCEVEYGQFQPNQQKRTSHRAQSSAKSGTCHNVEFELSDQRPAQEQYKEADFLDAEPSDDAEWNGRDEPSLPRYNAKRYGW